MKNRASFILLSFFVYSSMEVTRTSETSVDFQRIKWRYIREDRTHFGNGDGHVSEWMLSHFTLLMGWQCWT
jgi:hypothetical protein